MINLGRKRETCGCPTRAKPPDDNEMSYPSLYISDNKDLHFTDKDAGKKFTITAEVIVRSVTSRSDKDGKSDDVTLDFVSLDVAKRKGKDDLVKSLKGEN